VSSIRFHYATEKLNEACRGLATGEGDVRSRLVKVFGTLERLRAYDDLPPELAPRLVAILDTMTAEPPLRRPDGTVLRTSVEQSMQRKINRTAARIAKEIVTLKIDLDRFKEHIELDSRFRSVESNK
jgi:hypothetical protein